MIGRFLANSMTDPAIALSSSSFSNDGNVFCEDSTLYANDRGIIQLIEETMVNLIPLETLLLPSHFYFQYSKRLLNF
jgi:hypothetical protein